MKKIFTLFTLMFTMLMFSAPTTWNGTSWSSGPPTFNDNATIDGDYIVGLSDGPNNFICRNLTINAGATFTILSGYYMNVGNGIGGGGNFVNYGNVVVQNGSDFWIYKGILINYAPASNFVIEDGGAMVQIEHDGSNIGEITIKRNTKPVKLNDYTYWSSPVYNQLYNLLPPLTTNRRVFTYSDTNIGYGWGNNLVSTNGTMDIGRGYIAHKAVVNDPNPQQIHTMNFIGIPNTGDISIPLTSFIGNRPNVGYIDGSTYLTGNPYPSTLDMNNFLTTNSASAVYLWTHNTIINSSIPGSEVYNYTVDDYATYNLSGGVAASSPIIDGTPNNTAVPSRYIGSGQGFFVKAPTLGSKVFTFNNSMRGYMPTTTNVQFYRQAETETTEYNRIWLFLTNNFNITRYNMVGYVTGADNGFNHQYDAEMMDGRVAAIYSVLNDKDLSIQGRALPFDDNDQIPIGYILPIDGTFQIGLNQVDGLFTDVSQPIYLEDTLLGVTHDLRTGPYTFTALAGTNETRFILKFLNSTLTNSNFINETTYLYNQGDYVVIKSRENINDVVIYDTLGRLVYSNNNVNNTELHIPNLKGIMIVKMNINGTIVTRKHII